MFGYKEPKQIAPAAAQPIPATHNIKVALFTAGLISLSLHGLQIAKHDVDSIFSTGRCQVQAATLPVMNPSDYAAAAPAYDTRGMDRIIAENDVRPPLPVNEQAKVYVNGQKRSR